MISPFDMYFAFTPVIAMKSTGCLRFPECPRVGGAGRMIFFKGQKAVPWTRANRDVADQDFSDLRASVRVEDWDYTFFSSPLAADSRKLASLLLRKCASKSLLAISSTAS